MHIHIVPISREREIPQRADLIFNLLEIQNIISIMVSVINFISNLAKGRI